MFGQASIERGACTRDDAAMSSDAHGATRAREARRLLLAKRARATLEHRRPGRAWINGREVGGTDPRLAHLRAVYD